MVAVERKLRQDVAMDRWASSTEIRKADRSHVSGPPSSSEYTDMRTARPDGETLALTSFELGKLKIVGHVREELDRAGIVAQSIRCISGGIETPRGVARLTIIVNGTKETLDLKAHEVEDCELIVAGETWHKIAALIGRLAG
jgi:hypothetical protein